ncbi:hypothetical protein AGR4B_pAt20131 [Agrobacterium tumefaciens str. CFBP 5621]|nr:hypothetical protein AGR4B_pAt20131 [Agrobacterium tumefaciens str. CFBP 5621]
MFSINTINATRWYNAKRKSGANLAETQQCGGTNAEYGRKTRFPALTLSNGESKAWGPNRGEH